MKIININKKNLQDLYKSVAYVSNQYIGTNKSFEGNLYQVLNNYGIYLRLEEVSEYEYIILKKLFINISKFYRYEISSDDTKNTINNTYKEIKDVLNDAIKLIENINSRVKEETNIDIDFSRAILPSGILIGSCFLYITGYQLLSFMDNNPENFFKEITNGKCILNDKMNEDYIFDDDEVDNNIMDKFGKYFYSNIISNIFKNDVISDGLIFINYNNKFKDIPILKQGLVISPKIISDNQTNINFGDFDISKYFITFDISSSFGTYFELMNIFPIRCFTTEENLNIVSKYSSIENVPDIFKIFNKYKNLNGLDKFYKNIEDYLLNEINDNYNNTPNIIKKYELSMNYVNYRYSITLSLSDINTYIGNAIGNYSSKNKDVFCSEVKSILLYMIRISKDIYDSFVKS